MNKPVEFQPIPEPHTTGPSKQNQEPYDYKAFLTDKTKVKIIRFKVPRSPVAVQTKRNEEDQPIRDAKPTVQVHEHSDREDQGTLLKAESALAKQLETVCDLLGEMARELVRSNNSCQRRMEIHGAISLLHSQQLYICNTLMLLSKTH